LGLPLEGKIKHERKTVQKGRVKTKKNGASHLLKGGLEPGRRIYLEKKRGLSTVGRRRTCRPKRGGGASDPFERARVFGDSTIRRKKTPPLGVRDGKKGLRNKPTPFNSEKRPKVASGLKEPSWGGKVSAAPRREKVRW